MSNITTSNRSKLSNVDSLEREEMFAVKGEKVEMSLNTDSVESIGLIMQRLTGLYKDPVQATVRETVSNAIDAVTGSHSGVRPVVKISVPTKISPILVIRDNGIGMSADDLRDIYSKYGASTKSDNLDQIGAYGLGAKAPLSYGTEFTVTSIKNGEKTILIVSREELTNYINIIDICDTDEPSGTTVSIPVKSDDIHRFDGQVDNYRENPLDKDIDLYINEQLVESSKYTELTDDVLICDGEEKTYGRVWVKNEELVKLLTYTSVDDIRESLRFVIGGWTYDSPTYTRGYYGLDGLIVELKAGIVGFNSSRDNILESDRYHVLEDLIIDYVKSDKFTDNLISHINLMEIDEFKDTSSRILTSQKRWLELDDNNKAIINIDSTSHNAAFAKTFSLDDITHKETGLNINNILSFIPKSSKDTVMFRERRDDYAKIGKSAIMIDAHSRFDYNSDFRQRTVSEINQEVDLIMNFNNKSHTLGESHRLGKVMLKLIEFDYNSKPREAIKMTFVTNIDNEDNVKKLKSSRKGIVRLRNEGDIDKSYNSILIYTKHTKDEIDKLVDAADFINSDVKVFRVEEVLDEVKDFRARHRTNKSKTSGIGEELSTDLAKLNSNGDGFSYSYNINSISKYQDNVFIISRDKDETFGELDYNKIKMIRNWYCNDKGIDENHVDIYTSSGIHRVTDLELLMDKGVIFRDPDSNSVSDTKFYNDNIHDNVAQLNAIIDSSEDSKNKAFIRLISAIYGSSPLEVVIELEDIIDNAYNMSKIAGVNLTAYQTDILDDMRAVSYNFSTTRFLSSREWSLQDSAISHLLDIIGEDNYSLIYNITSLLNCNSIDITDSENFVIDRLTITRDITFDITEAENVYESNKGSSAYNKMTKVNIGAYLEFVNSVIKDICLLK